jgi:hemerythrin superfamily protein
MDAISLLKDDHRTVERLFKRFEKTGDRALVDRRRIVNEIIRELSIHAELEETIFYPAVREAVPPTGDMVLESLEEHHVVKWLLSELDGMAPDAERFEAKVTVLMENVRHHVEEEESDLFPKVRRALSRKALDEMGEAMGRAKAVVPTRPHPRSPDTPPGNLVSGVVASALDRAREAGQEFVEGAAGVARRAAANATSGGTPTKRTRRTTAAKKTTAKKTTKKAAGSAKKTARKATGTTKRTAKKATGSAKKTARKATGTAKRTTKRTTTTTKKATGTAKRTASRATGTTKKATGTTKKATGTAKRTASRATGTTKKATRTAKSTGRKATSRPRKAAKKRS